MHQRERRVVPARPIPLGEVKGHGDVPWSRPQTGRYRAALFLDSIAFIQRIHRTGERIVAIPRHDPHLAARSRFTGGS